MPGSQGSHGPPGLHGGPLAYVPGPQGVHIAWPVLDDLPDGQNAQAIEPLTELKVPELQGIHALALLEPLLGL